MVGMGERFLIRQVGLRERSYPSPLLALARKCAAELAGEG